jgi:SAM-dependent methyltransferase
MEHYLYFGNLGRAERQFQIPNFVGLALVPSHDREIAHNALDALPFSDDSIPKIQSQDVFEHLPFERLPFVMDEIYRVLKPGGVFRLSVPDYRSPLLKKRSIYDDRGKVIGDLMMGASAKYNAANGTTKVNFTEDGNAHLWFPKYELILELIVKSNIRKCNRIKFHQCFLDDETFLSDPIPQDEMFVIRSIPNDMRSNGMPISIVTDFEK